MDMDMSWADDLADISTVSGARNMADVDDLMTAYLQEDDAAWSEFVPIPVGVGNNERAEAAWRESSVPIPVEAGNQMGEAAWYGSVHVPVVPGNEMVEAIEEGTVNLLGTEADGGGRRPGDERWWDTVYGSEEHFRIHFRMSRSTFAFVCNEVADVICKDAEACPVTFIPVPERVAICLWRLVHGESLTTVAKRFNHARATCHRIFHDVCAAFMSKVVGKEVLWPDAAAMAANAAKFQALSGIQGVIGAVYTTRFTITAPKHNPTDYSNPRATARNSGRSSSYSITLQASVNADGAFTEVFAGHPGGKSDEETLLAWTLSKPELTGQILGERMHLVGGAGYPLTNWMMVPYSHQNLTPAQQSFNEGVDKVLAGGVETFRRFKARWSFLQKRIDIKLKGEKKNESDTDVDLALVLEVCCALQNICERLGDPLDPELLQGVKLNDNDGGLVADDNPSPSASDLRDTLAADLVISMGTV